MLPVRPGKDREIWLLGLVKLYQPRRGIDSDELREPFRIHRAVISS